MFSATSSMVTVSNDGLITAWTYYSGFNYDVGSCEVMITAGNVTEEVQVKVINSYEVGASTNVSLKVGKDRYDAYPLVFAQVVPDCTGFRLTYVVDEITGGKGTDNKNWRVVVYEDGKGWKVVGEVLVRTGVPETVNIEFDPMNITMLDVIPPKGTTVSGRCYTIYIASLETPRTPKATHEYMDDEFDLSLNYEGISVSIGDGWVTMTGPCNDLKGLPASWGPPDPREPRP